MDALINPLKQLDSFQKIIAAIKQQTTPILVTGVIDSQKAHLSYGIQKEHNMPALIVASSELKAREIYDDMRFFLGDKVMYYPSKDIIFYNADLKSIDIETQRFSVLHSLIHNEKPTIVLSVEALFDRLVEKDIFAKFILNLEVGQEISINRLAEMLVYIGYERRDLVESAGQFAVRGGIMDLFTAINDDAIRLEFWGDEIDSIRLLDSLSQRSIEKINEITIFPMRELVYTEAELSSAIQKIEIDYKHQLDLYNKAELFEEAKNLTETTNEAIEKLKESKSFSGVDKYIQYFYDNTVTILDYLSEDTILFFDEPARIASHAESVWFEFEESIKNRIQKGYMLPKQMNMVYSYAEILAQTTKFHTILYTTISHTVKEFTIRTIVDFAVKSAAYNQNPEFKYDELRYFKDKQFKTLILAGVKSRAERLITELTQEGFSVKYSDSLTEDLESGIITVSKGSLHKGFEYLHINLAVITDKEFFDIKKPRKSAKKKGNKIESFTDLRVGDYVVHDNHGIGIYKGIEKISVDGINKDYLKLFYSDGGHLYIPTGQMDMIQKYIGSDSAKPKLNKLGGSEWNKAKSKTKAAVKIIAKELIALYAERQEKRGYSFSSDTIWQKEFEDMFQYAETDDQLNAIEEMKKDMESKKVMDRLICGDVGYGKTEVAIRGAFKAVQDGKQVAYLVPTTILSQQHYNTFVQRMKDFPVNIEMLSRFKTPKQQKEILNGLETGLVDIVVGTHKLLSKSIKFKDLGLVIVDEEQRFGVTHKEKLKQMKKNVDVLTLTATPIPRTLHMSLTGIRDMSTLEEPPRERQPIQTYVMEYNAEFVRDAIHRELARDGQVYYLYNRVRNMDEIAKKLQDLVPEATVAFVHGQMTERELERIMLAFTEGEIDVLACTTIIETGLDIPNVNTIIIQDADTMGLSQLYQLRGRVGRSNRIAYAYLMYRKDKVLQETAEKRLQTIREFTEFGSGFKIAMRDLEIRGAGNILGAEQHGHMDVIGYDMYCKLLDQAIKEESGIPIEEVFETSVDININAYIPPYYIENEAQKLEIYKKISLIAKEEDYNEMQEEIEDRYGNIPSSVQNLLEIALFKAYANKAQIVAVKQKQKKIILTFKNNADIEPKQIFDTVVKYKDKLSLTSMGTPYLSYDFEKCKTASYILELKEILKEIIVQR